MSDDMKAAQAEADGELHKVDIRGETFMFRRIRDWPAEAFDLIQDGRLFRGVLMGLDDPDDEDRFRDLRPTIRDLEGVFNGIEEEEGVGAGNSSGSARSSRSTGRR